MPKYSTMRQAYLDLAAKYSLPEFDELIIRFGIKNLNWPEHLVLYNVLEGINKRIQLTSYVFESIIAGIGSEGYCEYRMLSKGQRSEVKRMWARLQGLRWGAYMGVRSLSEKQVADEINQSYRFHLDEFMPFAEKYSCLLETKWKQFKVGDSPEHASYS